MTDQDLDGMLDQLRNIVAPVVSAIEQSTPITQNHYDQYMSAIQTIVQQLSTNEKPSVYLGVAVAMQRAGGNKQGIIAALRAMGKL